MSQNIAHFCIDTNEKRRIEKEIKDPKRYIKSRAKLFILQQSNLAFSFRLISSREVKTEMRI